MSVHGQQKCGTYPAHTPRTYPAHTTVLCERPFMVNKSAAHTPWDSGDSIILQRTYPTHIARTYPAHTPHIARTYPHIHSMFIAFPIAFSHALCGWWMGIKLNIEHSK